jgi:hypothetical protein
VSRLGVLLGLAFAAAGCAVPYNAPLPVEQTDTCSSADDCGTGAACTNGVCVATEVSLPGLELEVIPDSNAPYGASTSFLFPLAGETPLTLSAENTTPFAAVFDPDLPPPLAISGGTFTLTTGMAEPSCSLVNGSLPGTITFYPIPPFTGPSVVPVVAMTTTATSVGNTFDANLVAPGLYDVYIQPQAVAGCNGGAAVPPVFLPKSQITSGAPSWSLPMVGTLTGTITDFGAKGWTAALVEPSRGLTVSSEAPLACHHGACSLTLQFARDDKTVQPVPILRLTPPSTAPDEPTIYWTLASTPLTPGASAAFSTQGLLVNPVGVSLTVTDTAGVTGIPAALSIQSTTLSGTVQQNAAFQIEGALTKANGKYILALPPGTYDVRAFPIDGLLGVTETTITVSSGCACDFTLPLQPKLSVTGTVTTPLGDPVANAQVGFTPSQTAMTSYWTNTHTLDAVAVQVAAATTDSDGNFALMVDQGSSDLTVQPDPGSGFPWLVQPALTVQTAPPPLSLALQSPAVLQGIVRDPSGMPVANAVVNAWFPLTDASSVATGTAVQIATTSTGADGSYTLLLPPSP